MDKLEKAKIPKGYYIKARKIKESEIAHAPPHVREIWDWLIQNANHKALKCGGKTIGRGQILTSYKDIREGLHWKVGWRKERYSRSQCENSLKLLRKATMIATQKSTRGIIITLLNYDYYQNPKNYECHKESHNESRPCATELPHYKQEWEECKKDNISSPVLKIFNYWNKYRGKSVIKPDRDTRQDKSIVWHSHQLRADGSISPEIEKALKAAFDGGHSVEQICGAIDNYAKVLLNKNFFWSYVWGLPDFLTRGEEKHKQAARKWWRFLPDNFIEDRYMTEPARRKRATQAKGPTPYEKAKQQTKKQKENPNEHKQTA